MKKIVTMSLFALLLLSLSISLYAQTEVIARTSFKAFEEAVECAAKISGKTLTRESRTVLARQLSKAALKNGDDVIKLARSGGVELIEAYGKYGDDVFRFSRKVPASTRVLAMHADELIPLTRKLGPSVLKIEARTPGMSKYIIKNFGDDAVKSLAKAPPRDIPKLVGYADRAVNDKAKRYLLKGYQMSNGKILKHIDWKVVMAGGLSASAVIAAYRASGGVESALKTAAEKSPDGFWKVADRTVNKLMFPYYILFGGGAVLLLLYFGFKLKGRWKKHTA